MNLNGFSDDKLHGRFLARLEGALSALSFTVTRRLDSGESSEEEKELLFRIAPAIFKEILEADGMYQEVKKELAYRKKVAAEERKNRHIHGW